MSQEHATLPLPMPEPERRADFVSRWFPQGNMAAICGYYFGIFGLAPLVGALLGPLAFSLGVIGLWRAIAEPEARGGKHAVFAIIAGFLETVLNWSALIVYLAFWWVVGDGRGAQ